MTIVNAYGDRRRQEVMEDTWGHLAPNPRRTYTGTITFAHACFGAGMVVIDYDFGDLPGSPWLMEDILDFAFTLEAEEYRIYVWQGTYRASKTSGVRFEGEHALLEAA